MCRAVRSSWNSCCWNTVDTASLTATIHISSHSSVQRESHACMPTFYMYHYDTGGTQIYMCTSMIVQTYTGLKALRREQREKDSVSSQITGIAS